MKKIRLRFTAAVSAAVILAGSALPVRAAAAYDSDYTQTVTMESLLIPALMNPKTNDDGVYRQLYQALRFQKLTQGSIFDMYQKGVRYPVAALQKLAADGLISTYLYKLMAGLPQGPEDFAPVFNAAYYYAANPDLAAAGIPYDENTLFVNFLTSGMQAGRIASAEFNPSYFQINYPQFAAALGDNPAAGYVFYLIYHEDYQLDCSRRLG